MRLEIRRARSALAGALLLWLALTGLSARAGAPEGSAAPGRLDERAALQVITACAASESASSNPLDATRNCPQLAEALVALGLEAQLRSDWRQHLDPAGIEGLLRLTQRYAAQAPSSPPTLARLSLVLRALQTPAARHLSWWQRFERWLGGLLSPTGRSNSDWLQQLLSHLSLPRWLQRVTLYGSIAVLLAMAGYIVWLELRAAGMLSRRTARRTPGRQVESIAVAAAAELKFEDVQRAAASERCVWLLRLLVQALRRSGRLSHERTLTYRELLAQPVFDDGLQRARFERLALLAERQRYDSLSLDDAAWRELLAEGRILYARWSPADAALASAETQA